MKEAAAEASGGWQEHRARTSGLSYRDQRFSCVLGMFSRLEVKVLYPT